MYQHKTSFFKFKQRLPTLKHLSFLVSLQIGCKIEFMLQTDPIINSVNDFYYALKIITILKQLMLSVLHFHGSVISKILSLKFNESFIKNIH